MTTAVAAPPHLVDICRSLRRYGIPPSQIEDLAQDVYVIALGHWTQNEQPARAWLLAIAFNVARNWRRCARRRPGHDELCEDNAVAGASPETDYVEAERLAGVYEAIDTLPEDLREVFLLAEIESISMREIAAMQGVPLSRVQSHLRRAREAFWKEAERRRAAGLLAAVALVLPERTSEATGSLPSDVLKPAGSGLRRVGEMVGVSVVSAGLAAGLTFALMLDRPPSVPAEPDRTMLVSEVVPAPVPPVVQPEPVSVAPADRTPPRPDANAGSSVDAELIIMERASGEYNDGNYLEALALLNRHLQLYPKGTVAGTRDNLLKQVEQKLSKQSKRLNR